MANYYATCRSNYFKVKDKDAFVAHCGRMNLGVWDGRDDGLVGVYAEDGGWPSYADLSDEPKELRKELGCDEDGGWEFNVVDEIQKHLADGEVCILMEAGAEKLRYVAGNALAFNNKGDVRELDLGQIYGMAKDLTDRPDDITEAEY